MGLRRLACSQSWPGYTAAVPALTQGSEAGLDFDTS